MNDGPFHFWPWLVAFGIGFFVASYAILSSGCATAPSAADVINDAADITAAAQCLDKVAQKRTDRLQAAAKPAPAVAPAVPQDAGMPARIDTHDPYPDAGVLVPECFVDGGH